MPDPGRCRGDSAQVCGTQNRDVRGKTASAGGRDNVSRQDAVEGMRKNTVSANRNITYRKAQKRSPQDFRFEESFSINWWRWRLCSDTPIAPQNPAFLSIPRSRLARYDTSSAAFRLLIYGEKVGKKPFHGEEMGNF